MKSESDSYLWFDDLCVILTSSSQVFGHLEWIAQSLSDFHELTMERHVHTLTHDRNEKCKSQKALPALLAVFSSLHFKAGYTRSGKPTSLKIGPQRCLQKYSQLLCCAILTSTLMEENLLQNKTIGTTTVTSFNRTFFWKKREKSSERISTWIISAAKIWNKNDC